MRKGQRVIQFIQKGKKKVTIKEEKTQHNIIDYYEIVRGKVNDQPTFFFVEANKQLQAT